MEPTTNQVTKNMNLNPTGKGGFGERPHDISPGGWKKENVLSYQYKRFLSMTAEEFEKFAKTPKSQMTMAEYGAFSRVKQLSKSLPDAKEIADRTEGKAMQPIEMKAEIHSVDSILD